MFLLRWIDNLTEWVTVILCHFIIIIMCILCYEVFMRYVFSAPTMWVHDMTQYLFGISSVMYGSYVLKHKKHITVDLIYNLFSERTKSIIDSFILLVIVAWGFFYMYLGFPFAYEAFYWGEKSFSMFEVVLWPVKLAIPLAGIMLFLQAGSMWICAVYKAITNKELDPWKV